MAVAADMVSRVVGRGGQNVRLASKVSGWLLNEMMADQVGEKSASDPEAAAALCEELLAEGVPGLHL